MENTFFYVIVNSMPEMGTYSYDMYTYFNGKEAMVDYIARFKPCAFNVQKITEYGTAHFNKRGILVTDKSYKVKEIEPEFVF